jgi:hypothetical protein
MKTLKTSTYLLVPALAALLGGCATGGRDRAASGAIDPLQARGESPGWRLTVTPARIVFSTDDGAILVNEANPRRAVPREGRIAGQRINVSTALRSCALSSGAFAQTVSVSVDGRTFSGCGGEQSRDNLLVEGDWTILSVNGRPTPVIGAFEARFAGREATLRFGCGPLTTRYTLSGQILSAGPIRKSQATCADPSFQDAAEKSLALPYAIEMIGGEQLILRNALGTLNLARARR